MTLRSYIVKEHFNFLIADECPLHSYRLGRPLRWKEHISLPKQSFRSPAIQYSTRVHLRRYRKWNSGWKIRLDNACNNIDWRPLCSKNHMDSCRACLLQNSADSVFHILRRNHHKICQLINNNNDEWDIFFRIATIEGPYITNTVCRKDRITLLHFLYSPIQYGRGFFRIGHNGNHQMRNTIVIGEFNHLRINQNEFYFIWCCLEQNAWDQGVNAHRFTRSCCTCNQKMRHFSNIRKDCLSTDVHPQSDCKFRWRLLKLWILQNLSKLNTLQCTIWNLDTDCCLSRYGFDTNRWGCKLQGNIFGKIGNFTNFDTRRRFQIVTRYCRAVAETDNLCIHMEALKCLL